MSTIVEDVVKRPLEFKRGTASKGLPLSGQAVNRTGGDKGAGLIAGFAVCTVGEALGHYMWCDATMLDQIVEHGNAKLIGLKARFTHPGLSSDGLGSFLGRAKNFRLDGEVVRADLHIDETAHDTPDGDLGKYAMDLAESDPEAFGSSIVFKPDYKAEKEFELANQVVDDKGNSSFKSPDPRNKKNYFHARIAELRACDVVDEPAANPDGLFHIPSDALSEAQAFMAYALGLSTEKPNGQLASQINPERARGFAARFLEEQGLTIGPKEKPQMPDPTTPTETLSADQLREQARQEARAESQKYAAKFGAKGAEWYASGKTWDECRDLHEADLKAERDAALAAQADAEAKLKQLDRGETTPVETGASDSKTSSYSEIIAKNR